MRLNMVSERKIGTLFHKEHKPTNRVCLIKQTVLEVSSRQCETLRRFVGSSNEYLENGDTKASDVQERVLDLEVE